MRNDRPRASGALEMPRVAKAGTMLLAVLAGGYFAAYYQITHTGHTKVGPSAVAFPAYFGERGWDGSDPDVRIATVVFAPAHWFDRLVRPGHWETKPRTWPAGFQPHKATGDSRSGNPPGHGR